jgi:ubiquinone/menaquinone biosynthesis C-methylase UbiE
MNAQDQQEVWDALAEQWYHFRQQLFRDTVDDIEKISSMKPGKILDIGCGNCRNLQPFAKKGFDCYGIDFSSEMLSSAGRYSKKYGFKVKLKNALAEKLPFPSSSFDYCLSIALLHHLNKKGQENAVKEMHRILKPNGIALVAVWNKSPLSLFIKQRYVKWTKAGKTYYRYYYFFTIKELKRLLEKTGFEIIKIKKGKNLVFLVRKIL